MIESDVELRDGRMVTLRSLKEEDQDSLLAMFSSMSEAALKWGMPPYTRETIERWIASIQSLISLVAIHEDRIVGYSAIFKHQHPRRLGVGEMGIYLQPIERGRGCHLEFNLYYDPEDLNDRGRIRNLYDEAAEVLLNMGALFTRPYDGLSELVYSRTTDYTSALKKVKNLFDPNNIMCPGNLCF